MRVRLEDIVGLVAVFIRRRQRFFWVAHMQGWGGFPRGQGFLSPNEDGVVRVCDSDSEGHGRKQQETLTIVEVPHCVIPRVLDPSGLYSSALEL